MSKPNDLINEQDDIKINYLLENLDTNETFLKENIVVNVSQLETELQKQIINSRPGSWFCINFDKVNEDRHLKINTSKFKNAEVGDFIVLDVDNKDQHRLVGKVIKKTTKYTLFDLKTPFEEYNWKVSVEVLEVVSD